ncbi:multidrug effflux MFS transporter [Arundinibacter roseus]|uniref:Bcr/CflA family efflux MFS transporter n=1 Tax=Arundinibacter roseus TaxID=2070510 RepID=A0A4R4KJT3_9BACT|nr:multidrug effflux MFS transporter [Arundinibacter roseus]TDB66869.1 Bcr/CflA family efflux MFS transporter [Arundinibacter roseus]
MNPRELKKIILLLGVLSALGPFSIDMYLPGFPAIAADLNTSIAEVGYSLTSYFIGISVGQLLYGPIVDRFGRKIPILFGLTLYTLAAVACAWAPSIEWLIGLRMLLALGGCAGMVAGRAVVRDLFPPSDIAKVISTLMLVMGAAPLIAPTIGGWMVTVLGWRAIFYTLALISASMLTAVFLILPESRGPDPSVKLAPASVLKGYWYVVKEPAFIVYGLAGGFTMASLFAYISGSPFIFMEKLGFTQTQYGFLFSFNSFGYIAGSQLNRLALKRFNSLQIAENTSLIVALFGFLLVLSVSFSTLSAWILLGLLFLFLFGNGFLGPNSMALALAPFSEHAGSASALIGFSQMFFGAVASAMVSVLHNQTAFPMTGVMAFCAICSASLILVQRLILKRRQTVVHG